jgi:hypothetical protein
MVVSSRPVSPRPEIGGCRGGTVASDVLAFIDGCIQRTIPQHQGTRHKCVFQLARLLQGNPEVASWSPHKLRPVVNEWFRQAAGALGVDGIKATADENWFDFSEGWRNVKFPGEGGLMNMLLATATDADLPACAMQYQTEEVRLVVKLCRELQRHAGKEPFSLSVSMVNDLILKAGENRMRGWRILRGLVLDGVVEEVEKGTASGRRASSFRYLGD